jgi:hypothetical protein
VKTTGLRRAPLSGGVKTATNKYDLPSPAVAVRNLVEQAQFAHLCTVMSTMHHRRGGYPFGTLVDFASDGAGYPIFCLSPLAIHARNLIEDPRCAGWGCWLLAAGDGMVAGGDGLEAGALAGPCARRLQQLRQQHAPLAPAGRPPAAGRRHSSRHGCMASPCITQHRTTALLEERAGVEPRLRRGPWQAPNPLFPHPNPQPPTPQLLHGGADARLDGPGQRARDRLRRRVPAAARHAGRGARDIYQEARLERQAGGPRGAAEGRRRLGPGSRPPRPPPARPASSRQQQPPPSRCPRRRPPPACPRLPSPPARRRSGCLATSCSSACTASWTSTLWAALAPCSGSVWRTSSGAGPTTLCWTTPRARCRCGGLLAPLAGGPGPAAGSARSRSTALPSWHTTHHNAPLLTPPPPPPPPHRRPPQALNEAFSEDMRRLLSGANAEADDAMFISIDSNGAPRARPPARLPGECLPADMPTACRRPDPCLRTA